MSYLAGGNSGPGAEPGRNRWPAISALVVLLLAVMAGGIYSWARWGAGRTDRTPHRAVDLHEAKKAFLAEIEAGRWEAAYQSTTASFRGRVSQQAFSERAERYRAFKQKPGVRGVEGSAGDTLWGDHGPRQQVFTNTLEDREGNQLRYSVMVVQEDGDNGQPIPRVAEFTVVVGGAEAPEKR